MKLFAALLQGWVDASDFSQVLLNTLVFKMSILVRRIKLHHLSKTFFSPADAF